MKKLTLLLVCFWLLAACQTQQKTLRLATTTSTYDSGLIDEIMPAFEEEHNVRVDVIAVGTGEALALGRAGDVDIVLVHARQLEDEFVAEGYGTQRYDVMYNDFVLLGPADDPAAVADTADVTAALKLIAAAEAPFISRGDNSGTHIREQALWQAAEITPAGEWYQSVGQGMGATLNIANEQQAYTLSDRGTYLARKATGDTDLIIVSQGDERLFNPYGVIPVNPALNDSIDGELANALAQWFISPETQLAIGQFQRNGEQLFFPDATP